MLNLYSRIVALALVACLLMDRPLALACAGPEASPAGRSVRPAPPLLFLAQTLAPRSVQSPRGFSSRETARQYAGMVQRQPLDSDEKLIIRLRRMGVEADLLPPGPLRAERLTRLAKLDEEFGAHVKGMQKHAMALSVAVERLFLHNNLHCPEDSGVLHMMEDPARYGGLKVLLEATRTIAGREALRQELGATSGIPQAPAASPEIARARSLIAEGDAGESYADYVQLALDLSSKNHKDVLDKLERIYKKRLRLSQWYAAHQFPYVQSLRLYRLSSLLAVFQDRVLRLEDPARLLLSPPEHRPASGKAGLFVQARVPLERVFFPTPEDSFGKTIRVLPGQYERIDPLAPSGILSRHAAPEPRNAAWTQRYAPIAIRLMLAYLAGVLAGTDDGALLTDRHARRKPDLFSEQLKFPHRWRSLDRLRELPEGPVKKAIEVDFLALLKALIVRTDNPRPSAPEALSVLWRRLLSDNALPKTAETVNVTYLLEVALGRIQSQSSPIKMKEHLQSLFQGNWALKFIDEEIVPIHLERSQFQGTQASLAPLRLGANLQQLLELEPDLLAAMPEKRPRADIRSKGSSTLASAAAAAAGFGLGALLLHSASPETLASLVEGGRLALRSIHEQGFWISAYLHAALAVVVLSTAAAWYAFSRWMPSAKRRLAPVEPSDRELTNQLASVALHLQRLGLGLDEPLAEADLDERAYWAEFMEPPLLELLLPLIAIAVEQAREGGESGDGLTRPELALRTWQALSEIYGPEDPEGSSRSDRTDDFYSVAGGLGLWAALDPSADAVMMLAIAGAAAYGLFALFRAEERHPDRADQPIRARMAKMLRADLLTGAVAVPLSERYLSERRWEDEENFPAMEPVWHRALEMEQAARMEAFGEEAPNTYTATEHLLGLIHAVEHPQDYDELVDRLIALRPDGWSGGRPASAVIPWRTRLPTNPETAAQGAAAFVRWFRSLPLDLRLAVWRHQRTYRQVFSGVRLEAGATRETDVLRGLPSWVKKRLIARLAEGGSVRFLPNGRGGYSLVNLSAVRSRVWRMPALFGPRVPESPQDWDRLYPLWTHGKDPISRRRLAVLQGMPPRAAEAQDRYRRAVRIARQSLAGAAARLGELDTELVLVRLERLGRPTAQERARIRAALRQVSVLNDAELDLLLNARQIGGWIGFSEADERWADELARIDAHAIAASVGDVRAVRARFRRGQDSRTAA